MPQNNEQKQDVFDPSRFKFIGASADDDIFKEHGPDIFTKNERIVSIVLHVLFALGAISLVVLGIYYGTESSYRYESWGFGAVFGLAFAGIVLLATVLVSLFHHEKKSQGKESALLAKANTAMYYVCFAAFYTGFALLALRPAVMEKYLLSAPLFPFSPYSAYILIAVCWVLAIGGILFENLFKDQYVKEIVQDVFLALALYFPFFFYSILTKTYVLSSMNTARPWLILAPIVLDLGVVFKVLGRTKKYFHTAFHVCAFGAVVMELAMLVTCGFAQITTLVG